MIKVYGASDDLIEIEGDLREEFDVYAYDENYLTFSDGTVLKVAYVIGGIWKIEPVRHGSATYCKLYEATDESEDKGEGYTDIVTLAGLISSVGISKNAPAIQEAIEEPVQVTGHDPATSVVVDREKLDVLVELIREWVTGPPNPYNSPTEVFGWQTAIWAKTKAALAAFEGGEK